MTPWNHLRPKKKLQNILSSLPLQRGKTSEIGMFTLLWNSKAFTIRMERIKVIIEYFYWVLEFGHFDAKSFRYKSTWYKLKSFPDIIEVDLIHVESRLDSTQPLCSQLSCGSSGAKTAIPVSQWRYFQAPTVMKTLPIRDSFEGPDKNCENH